jgi:hypothetical protein
MDDSLANILGIIVDGDTIVYVSYKTGHRVWKNREDPIRRGQRLRDGERSLAALFRRSLMSTSAKRRLRPRNIYG